MTGGRNDSFIKKQRNASKKAISMVLNKKKPVTTAIKAAPVIHLLIIFTLHQTADCVLRKLSSSGQRPFCENRAKAF